MNSICTLYDQERNLAETVLCRDLRTPYGGDLYFPVAPAGRPYVVANFWTGSSVSMFRAKPGCADQWLRSRRPFHYGFVTRFSGCRSRGGGHR
jgi:hypothetical protein